MSEGAAAGMRSRSPTGRRVLFGVLMMALLALTALRAAEGEQQANEEGRGGDEGAQTNVHKVVESVTGRWRFVGGDAERQKLAAEIEEVVDGMSFFKRPFARPRLQAGNEIPSRLVITHEDGIVGIYMDDERYRAKLDAGWEQGSGSDGADLRYRHLVDGGHLVQIFDADRGTRFNWFVRTGSDRLKMVVKVVSSHFSEPLVYELTYVRQQATRDDARRSSSGDAS